MTNPIKQVAFAVLAAAALALLFTSAQRSSAAIMVTDSKSFYAQECSACHGADGTGNTAAGKKLKVRAFAAPEVQKLTDAKLSEIISKGKDKMPAFASKHSADEIKQLVAHIRTFAKK